MSSKKTQMEFGNRLKVVRSEQKLSQKEMATKLNIAVSTYQHYERGEREAPASLIPKIATFGFSFEWLLTGKGTPYIEEGQEPQAAEKVIPFDPAVQLINEAEEETGIKLSPKQREAVAKILRREIERRNRDAKERSKLEIKDLIASFKGEDGGG